MYGEPTELEKTAGNDLIDQSIEIYWDGDNIYYPGKVTGYDENTKQHCVIYDNDETNEIYTENLMESSWRIWRGTEDEKKQLDVQNKRIQKKEKEKLMGLRMSYQQMVVEAVLNLNERPGSTIQAIRKYVSQNYPMKAQQTASFNNLTMKAINKAIANNELEKSGLRTYKLTDDERDKRDAVGYGIPLPKTGSFVYSQNGLPIFWKGKPLIKEEEFFNENYFYGTAAERNKQLRKELIFRRNRRDKYLLQRIDALKSFMPSKNYFFKKYQVELAVKMQKLDTKLATSIGSAMNPVETAPDDETNLLFPMSESDLKAIKLSIQSTGDDEESEVKAFYAMMERHNKAIKIDQGLNSEAIEKTTNDREEDEEEMVMKDPLVAIQALRGVKILKPPPSLNAELHDHQVSGISWMVHMFENGLPMILGDQMGLGKTIQSIGFIAQLEYLLQKRGPHLIVVPLSVLSNWISEIERFCPSLRAVRFHGPKLERNRIKAEELNDLKEFDIVVTTYEMLVSEVNFFKRKYVWTSIIIDEGHRLKNERSQFSEKLRSVPCLSKVILTGTPLQNNLRELWAMLHYLAPDIFTPSSAEKFTDGFDLTKGVIDSNVLRKARKLLSVFMLRRIKDNVSIKLPSRKELTLLVPLTNQQADLYKQLLCGLDSDTIETVMRESNPSRSASIPPSRESNAAAIESSIVEFKAESGNGSTTLQKKSSDTPPSDSDWRKLMNLLLQLRKICNHTYLMPDVAPDPYEITEDLVSGSGKLLMLDRMLPRLREDGHRVLLFSQFTSMLDILEDYCELRQYPFVRLDGETNRVKRRLDVRRFNAINSNLFIFLISTRAGGLGLNLASADTVILYDSDWNPQVDLQAMERAHRIGQTKPVRVYRLVCRGSVEERMVSRAEKKLFLNAMVAETDPDEQLQEDHDGAVSDPQEKDKELSHALGIGGTVISKGELASLIRFGANAVFDSEANALEESSGDQSNLKTAMMQISDEELDKLLERAGRDVVVDTIPDNQPDEVLKQNAITNFEVAAAVLKDRMEMLKEVDLRQLGNVLYLKKKKSVGGMNELTNLEEEDGSSRMIVSDTKRVRKERIVMMNGIGTGYGGNVPVYADLIESNPDEGNVVKVQSRSKGRLWTHQEFCVLCGKRNGLDTKGCKCAHCPFVFHIACLENFEMASRSSGMFACPHHRCSLCGRNTQSAGGMLFRCVGCLTAYCEDCLPQDEIESVGRCRELESLGYDSKQSYFIKCPTCCVTDEAIPKGILNDQNISLNIENEAKPESGHEDSIIVDEETMKNDGVGEVASNSMRVEEGKPSFDGGELVPIQTQLMRIYWEEIIPPPSKQSKSKKKIAKRKAGRAENNKSKRVSRRNVEDKEEFDEEEKDCDDHHEEDPHEEEADEEEDEDEAGREEKHSLERDLKLSRDYVDSLPGTCAVSEALDWVVGHPLFIKLFGNETHLMFELMEVIFYDQTQSYLDQHPMKPIDIDEIFAHIYNKIEKGRYRHLHLFITDLNYGLDLLHSSRWKKVIQSITGLTDRSSDEPPPFKVKPKEFTKWKQQLQLLLNNLKFFLNDVLERKIRVD